MILRDIGARIRNFQLYYNYMILLLNSQSAVFTTFFYYRFYNNFS